MYSDQIKNLQDFEKRNFIIEEEDEMREGAYAMKYNLQKRPLSKNSHRNLNQNYNSNKNSNNNNQNFKHMPDHLASKLVDDILNSKFSQD